MQHSGFYNDQSRFFCFGVAKQDGWVQIRWRHGERRYPQFFYAELYIALFGLVCGCHCLRL